VRGNVNATIVANTVTGRGPIDYIAQNGIVVVGETTVAQISGNKVSGNWYTPAGTEATGILVIDGKVNIDKKNTLSGDEVAIYDAREISGKKYTPTPDTPSSQLTHEEARSAGLAVLKRPVLGAASRLLSASVTLAA